MPLSEHEQKMLDEMERQLFAEDPRLARTFRGADRPVRNHRRIVLGLVGILAGLGLLVLAVALPAIWLGVLAFLLMLGSALFAVTTAGASPQRGGAERGEGGTPVTPSSRRGGGGSQEASRSDFMRRMEERWERRSGSDGSR